MGDMAFRDDISRGSGKPGPSSGDAAAQAAVNDDRVLLRWAPMTLVCVKHNINLNPDTARERGGRRDKFPPLNTDNGRRFDMTPHNFDTIATTISPVFNHC